MIRVDVLEFYVVMLFYFIHSVFFRNVGSFFSDLIHCNAHCESVIITNELNNNFNWAATHFTHLTPIRTAKSSSLGMDIPFNGASLFLLNIRSTLVDL
jgi:hypothetical protein